MCALYTHNQIKIKNYESVDAERKMDIYTHINAFASFTKTLNINNNSIYITG